MDKHVHIGVNEVDKDVALKLIKTGIDFDKDGASMINDELVELLLIMGVVDKDDASILIKL